MVFIEFCVWYMNALEEIIAMEEELAALKSQFYMQTLCNKNNLILSGHESSVVRQKWANLLKFKLKNWDFTQMSPDLLFSSTLDNKAWAEYQTFKKKDGETDAAFSARVVEHFGKVPGLRSEEVGEFLSDLKTRRLLPGESYDEAYARLKSEIERLPWGEQARDDILRTTYSQLLPPIAREVLKLHGDSSADKYFELSRRYAVRESSVQGHHMSHLEHATPSLPQQEPEPSKALLDLEKKMSNRLDAQQAAFEKMTSLMSSLQASMADLAAPSSSTSNNTSNASTGNGNKNGKKGRVNNINRGPCQICGGTNHIATTCRQRNTGPTEQSKKTAAPPVDPEPKCQMCDTVGHVGRECRSKQAVRCNGCGQWGHFRNECSTNPPPYRNRYWQGRQGYGRGGYSHGYGRGGYSQQPLQYVQYSQHYPAAQAQQPAPVSQYPALPAPAARPPLNQ